MPTRDHSLPSHDERGGADRVDDASPRLLITAGPTQEPIDAVRYLSNRSSGRMGTAIAAAAIARGWETTLLLGPGVAEPAHCSALTIHRFRTTDDLGAALERLWPRHDVLIMAAAVSDYRPAADGAATSDEPRETTGESENTIQKSSMGKLRRGAALTLRLVATPDLLAAAASVARADQTTIGFALEPADGLEDAAARKLRRKSIGAIVANPLETMDATSVSGSVLLADGRWIRPASFPDPLPKEEFATWLLDQLPTIRAATPPATG